MYDLCKKFGKAFQVITSALFMAIGIIMFTLKVLESFITMLGVKDNTFLSNFIMSKINPDDMDIILMVVAIVGDFLIIILGILCVSLCGKVKYSNICLWFGFISLVVGSIVPLLNDNLLFMILCVSCMFFYTIVSYVLMKIYRKEEQEKQNNEQIHEISEDIL